MSADVRGSELWFETADVELTASTEMFATALLPIAAGAGATIELEGALDPVWRRNAARILRVWNGWWGYEPAIDAIVKAPEAQLGARPRGTRHRPLLHARGRLVLHPDACH